MFVCKHRALDILAFSYNQIETKQLTAIQWAIYIAEYNRLKFEILILRYSLQIFNRIGHGSCFTFFFSM